MCVAACRARLLSAQERRCARSDRITPTMAATVTALQRTRPVQPVQTGIPLTIITTDAMSPMSTRAMTGMNQFGEWENHCHHALAATKSIRDASQHSTKNSSWSMSASVSTAVVDSEKQVLLKRERGVRKRNHPVLVGRSVLQCNRFRGRPAQETGSEVRETS